ncbi:MAG: CPBP family intramembrane glutamic endopeptidase [Bacteroidales bacterium]
MTNVLRPFWSRLLRYDWKLGLALILLICVPRFILVMRANMTGSYQLIGIVMVVSALVPFILLNREGIRQIGITRPSSVRMILVSLVAGLIAGLFLYVIGEGLFGEGEGNWYRYIGRSYRIPEGIGGNDKLILFAITAGIGMIFSPIGEELFFRGIVHDAFARSIGENGASMVDSAAFALTHLAHFGLVYNNLEWQFLMRPALLWVIAMFLVGRLFFYFKQATGSLLGAILCHAAFNLAMIYSIFYLL